MSTEEAVSIIRSAVERFNSGGKLRSVFRTFDRNRDGYISLPEFSLALSEIGVRFETAVVKRVFDVFDRSGEGKMAYFEFVSQMSGPSSSSASSSSSVHRSSHQSATLKPSSSEQAAVLSSMSHPAVLPNDMSIDDILHKVCVSLSDAEQGRLRSVFRSIDRDGNGLITVSELAMALNRLHFSLEAGVVQKIFDLFDQDGNHYISYSEFVAAIARATHPSSASASAPAPESASASLSPAERQRLAMRKLMQQLADAHLETKVAAVFERIDTNNSGTITFVEFVAALRSMKGVDVPVACKYAYIISTCVARQHLCLSNDRSVHSNDKQYGLLYMHAATLGSSQYKESTYSRIHSLLCI